MTFLCLEVDLPVTPDTLDRDYFKQQRIGV